MDGVVYYRVTCPISSVKVVENAQGATQLLAQTTLRNVLGTKSLSELLSDRMGISQSMQVWHTKLSLDVEPVTTCNVS